MVNVSGVGGLAPVPGQTVYGASKAAVKLFTEGLYDELLGTPSRSPWCSPAASDRDRRQEDGRAARLTAQSSSSPEPQSFSQG